MPVTVEQLDLTTLKPTRPIVYYKVDLTPAHNVVGPFVLDLPATPENWELIQLDADNELVPFAILVDWNGVYQVPLMAEDWSFKRTIDGGRITEVITITGADFLYLLASRIAYPNPGAAWSGQTITTTTYTDKAETVIKTIVGANLVTAGDTNRRVPLLSVATDLARGSTVTYKVVTPAPAATTGTQTSTVAANLMDMVRAVDQQSPIGVRITLGDGELLLDCYVPRDLTEAAVFSAGLGNLPSAQFTASGPTANAILLQSNVTGSKFTAATGHGSTSPWRRVEQFSDQSSTDTAADITTAGTTAVAAGASKIALAVTALDLPNLRFGEDDAPHEVQGYMQGDICTIELRSGVVYSDTVGQVQLVADASPSASAYTETVTPTLGPATTSTDQTISAKLAARLRSLERKLLSGH